MGNLSWWLPLEGNWQNWEQDWKRDPPFPLQPWGTFWLSIPWAHIEVAVAKSLQSCPTLCNPRDDSPPGSPIPGILQARTLEWVAISFPNAWKWKVKVKSLSCVRLIATPWTAAHQALLSMGFSRQEYWSGVPLPSPRNERGSAKNYPNVELFCLWQFKHLKRKRIP